MTMLVHGTEIKLVSKVEGRNIYNLNIYLLLAKNSKTRQCESGTAEVEEAEERKPEARGSVHGSHGPITCRNQDP